jgi:hypothetical protein
VTGWVECRDCHRPLRDPESRSLGYGPDCARKHGLTPTKPRRTSAIPRLKPAPVPPAPDTIPGQTEIPLVFHQPTLESL